MHLVILVHDASGSPDDFDLLVSQLASTSSRRVSVHLHLLQSDSTNPEQALADEIAAMTSTSGGLLSLISHGSGGLVALRAVGACEAAGTLARQAWRPNLFLALACPQLGDRELHAAATSWSEGPDTGRALSRFDRLVALDGSGAGNGLLAAAGARAAAHSPTARKAVDGAARLLGTTTRAKSLSAADVASIGRALEESSEMAAAHEASRAEAEVERLRGEKEKAQSDAEVAQSHANVARQQLSMELRVLDAEERERRAEEAEEEEARLTARLAELEVAKQRQEAELEELKAAAEVQRRASDDSMSGLQRRASEGLEAVAARAELAESQFNAARRLQREELEIMEEEKRAAWEEEAERVIERARRQSEAEMDEARAKAAAELAAAKQEAEELRRKVVEDAESAAAAVAAAAATAAAEPAAAAPAVEPAAARAPPMLPKPSRERAMQLKARASSGGISPSGPPSG